MAKFKSEGGLGVGSLKEKNEVLHAEWLWRFPLESNSLWNLVISNKEWVGCQSCYYGLLS